MTSCSPAQRAEWANYAMSLTTPALRAETKRMFSKILVANRAEIAVRIIRTCRELGITSVAVHSDADAGAMHVRLADEAYGLPGVSASDTYLDVAKIVEIAVDCGADAVHPGYGFLAENAGFAKAVEDAGLTFIGPPSSAIDVMGEKVAARAVAAQADVPQVPGSDGPVETPEEILAFGETFGYPIAIKASYGGGGRGMRVVTDSASVPEAFASARAEATAAFGRGDVYLERYLDNARHVEVQVFADKHGNVVWLGDRDCSVQRRHQKVVEEAPAPGLSDAMRAAMGEASVRLAKQVGYVGAGTVEFLVEADREAFYFLEMNTRIQVEHPVTELVIGMDLIAEQIRVASGETLSLTTSGPAPRGHAMEVRLNAEDVTEGAFRPSPGRITALSIPYGAGVRFDGGYEAGDEVQPYYDSMIGKLIAWAPTREQCIDRLLDVMRETRIVGVPTTIPAAEVVLSQEDFRSASISTRWLEHSLNLGELLPAAPIPDAHDEHAEMDAAGGEELWVAGRRYFITPPLAVGAVAAAPSGGARRRAASTGGPGGKRAAAAGNGVHTSPMQGTVVELKVEIGQTVEAGDVLVMLEAMKMQNPVKATVGGTVSDMPAKVGDVVPAGTVLVVVEPADA